MNIDSILWKWKNSSGYCLLECTMRLCLCVLLSAKFVSIFSQPNVSINIILSPFGDQHILRVSSISFVCKGSHIWRCTFRFWSCIPISWERIIWMAAQSIQMEGSPGAGASAISWRGLESHLYFVNSPLKCNKRTLLGSSSFHHKLSFNKAWDLSFTL